MPKYLYIGTYTSQGAKGLLQDGGSARRDAARTVIESVGGKLESLHFGFGTDDVYVVADLPDHAAAAAVSLSIGAAGGLTGHMVVLMEPEEIDAAGRLTPSYRPPGG